MKKISFTPNRNGKIVIIAIIIIMVAILFKNRNALKSIAMKTVNYLKEKTWDIITDRRINSLHPKIREHAKAFIINAEKKHGIKLRVTSALRTWEEQAKIYAQGRTAPGAIVSNAKPGKSYHNYGLAFDVVEMKNGQPLWKNPNWNKIGSIGKQYGFSWGGDWPGPDRPHFQKTFGMHHTQLAVLYKNGKRSGNYINFS